MDVRGDLQALDLEDLAALLQAVLESFSPVIRLS